MPHGTPEPSRRAAAFSLFVSAVVTMKRRYNILGGIVLLLGVAVVSAGLFISHDAACGTAPALPASAATMKAIVYRCYGPARVLRYEDTAKPVPKDNEVLVRVHANSVNPLDWHYMLGTPYLLRLDSGIGVPTDPLVGATLVAPDVDITVNATPVLATPPTVMTTFPVVAPAGTETMMLVADHVIGATLMPLKVTVLVP